MKKTAWLLCVTLSAGAGGACGLWCWPARTMPAAQSKAAAPGKPPAPPPPREPSGPLADLARQMAGADLAALQLLAGGVLAWKDSMQRETALSLLCRGLAEVDAPAALQWARTSPGGDQQFFVRMLRAWAGVDADAAMEATYQDPNGGRSKESRALILAHLATVNPQKFFANAAADSAGHDVFVRAMQTLARHDPAEARRAYDSLDVRMRTSLTGPFAEGWAAHDAEGALAWARALPEPDRQGAIFGIITEIGPDDPATALREAGGYLKNTGDVPEWVVKAIARGLAQQDPVRALEWVLDYASGKDAVKTLAREILPLLAAGDGPDAAVKIVKALDPIYDDKVEAALKDFLKTWQPQDPAAQVRALLGQPRDDARTIVLNHVADLWAMRDTPGALAAARECQDEGARYCLAGALGNFYKAQGDDAGFMEVFPLLNPKFSAGFCSSMATRLTWEDAAAAAAFAAKLPEDSAQRTESLQAIGKVRGAQEPQAALTWAESLTEKDRIATAGSALLAWSAEDPLAASQWVQGHPAGDVRDLGSVMLAASLWQTEPDSAFAWLQGVEREHGREAYGQLYPLIYRQWVRTDPAAARQSIEDARISEELKATLRAQFAVFVEQTT